MHKLIELYVPLSVNKPFLNLNGCTAVLRTSAIAAKAVHILQPIKSSRITKLIKSSRTYQVHY